MNTLNVDPAELAKFGALAARWWDPGSEFKPLHDINPLRLNHIDQRVGLAGKKVLDVGCGGGILAESMAARGAVVTGIDLSEKPLKVAQLHLLESGHSVDYRLISAEDLAQQQPGSFDCVTCMEMIEHVPDPASTIQAVATLVKPGGSVFFSTLNRNPKSFLFAIIGAEYILNLLPKGTHEYRRFITPAEFAQMARAASLVVDDFIGMQYNPFNKRYSLGRDISVNYIVACRKP
ncbi:MAG: bifunctional 2-polyprenyl-6-hydroxyphenol methylase/3-demethylubiquinol 3-O-methyltransferase UbiG [Betaproteobacteria bacterium]|nr:bifunctional 2-polyprenyl-6-hydroxyphenol methylase/3-demethylubiquinol 3-O-methyltransferase UbiG [Betaproteobacteria bacterium]